MVDYVDASTLTDVCSSSSLPEVELVSLVQDSLPRYRLRALTAPDFTSQAAYQHTDWGVRTPQLRLTPEQLSLTPQQIEATLKYFVLCGERLTQMTHTYNDIEAVTRLLEEKERDLELAATIGQSLLDQNTQLLSKCDYLETQCVEAQDKGKQLAHELRQKEDILRIFSNEAYDPPRGISPSKEVAATKQFEAAQRRLKRLEEENQSLRSETANLKNETLEFEEKEQQLTEECVQRLHEAQRRISELQGELEKKTMECIKHQEESATFLNQLVAGQRKTKELTIENLELQEHLKATQATQRELTAEVFELQCKYKECKEMLDEAQSEIRQLQRKTCPRASPYSYGPSHSLIPPRDSLAAELSDSLMSDSDRSDRSDQRQSNLRAMKTAQYVRRLGSVTSTPRPSPSGSISSSRHSTSSTIGGSRTPTLSTSTLSNTSRRNRVSPAVTPNSPRGDHLNTLLNGRSDLSPGGALGNGDVSPYHIYPVTNNPLLSTPIPGSSPRVAMAGSRGSSRTSPATSTKGSGGSARGSGSSTPSQKKVVSTGTLNGGFLDKVKDMRHADLGRPGIPGSKDLEKALKRLSLRRQNANSEMAYQEAHEEEAASAMDVSMDEADSRKGDFSSGSTTPTRVRCHTPESELSGYGSGGGGAYKLPEKLQIVKPMEGSLTLQHWQRLATPHLGGFLEEREGVQTKGAGEHPLQIQRPSYSLMDPEEEVREPHKASLRTNHTYTYTTSRVMHPADGVATRYRPYSSPGLASVLSPNQATTPLPAYGSMSSSGGGVTMSSRSGLTMSSGSTTTSSSRYGSGLIMSMIRPSSLAGLGAGAGGLGNIGRKPQNFAISKSMLSGKR